MVTWSSTTQEAMFQGRLALGQTKDLWRRYVQQQNRVFSRTCRNQFCTRMCQLFQSRRNGRPSSLAEHKVRVQHEWSLPTKVVDSLRAVFSIDREYFSPPLNVHPGMKEFRTAKEADAAFDGARLNAYSAPWQGAGLSSKTHRSTVR